MEYSSFPLATIWFAFTAIVSLWGMNITSLKPIKFGTPKLVCLFEGIVRVFDALPLRIYSATWVELIDRQKTKPAMYRLVLWLAEIGETEQLTRTVKIERGNWLVCFFGSVALLSIAITVELFN